MRKRRDAMMLDMRHLQKKEVGGPTQELPKGKNTVSVSKENPSGITQELSTAQYKKDMQAADSLREQIKNGTIPTTPKARRRDAMILSKEDIERAKGLSHRALEITEHDKARMHKKEGWIKRIFKKKK